MLSIFMCMSLKSQGETTLQCFEFGLLGDILNTLSVLHISLLNVSNNANHIYLYNTFQNKGMTCLTEGSQK